MDRLVEQEEDEDRLESLWRGPYMIPITFDDPIYLLHDFVQWRYNSYECIEFNIELMRRQENIRSVEYHGVEFLYDQTRQIAVCTNLAYYTGE